MELDATRQNLMCCGTSEEKNAVLPLECSIILPDYYPDIMKVLSYGAETALLPVTGDSTGETVSGNVRVNVTYISEEGKLCFCNQLHPFSHVFAGETDISAAAGRAEPSGITCRAVNKRRIDVQGSLEVGLREIKQYSDDALSELYGEDYVCRFGETENVIVCGEYYKSFSVDEKAELGYGKPPFGSVLRSRVCADVSECRVSPDKIAVKGEIRLRVLWESAETEDSKSEILSSVFSFPVNRLLDAPGVLETDTCEAFLSADFPEITPDSEGNFLGVKLRAGVFARVYRKERVQFVSDAFSCAGESKTDMKELCVSKGAYPVSETVNITESFELPEEAESVIDIWAELPEQPTLSESGEIRFRVKFGALLRNADGGAAYYEKYAKREVVSPSGSSDTAFYDLRSTIVGEEFTEGRNGTAEISVSVFIDGTVYTCGIITAVEACTVCDSQSEKGFSAPLVFCFAEKGEDIRSLAKHYRTPPEKIKEENGFDSDTVSEHTVLIIPR